MLNDFLLNLHRNKKQWINPSVTIPHMSPNQRPCYKNVLFLNFHEVNSCHLRNEIQTVSLKGATHKQICILGWMSCLPGSHLASLLSGTEWLPWFHSFKWPTIIRPLKWAHSSDALSRRSHLNNKSAKRSFAQTDKGRMERGNIDFSFYFQVTLICKFRSKEGE